MITLFLLIPFIIYLFTLLFFCLANLKLQSHQITTDTNLGISVIIAIRNGEKSLKGHFLNVFLFFHEECLTKSSKLPFLAVLFGQINNFSKHDIILYKMVSSPALMSKNINNCAFRLTQ